MENGSRISRCRCTVYRGGIQSHGGVERREMDVGMSVLKLVMVVVVILHLSSLILGLWSIGSVVRRRTLRISGGNMKN